MLFINISFPNKLLTQAMQLKLIVLCILVLLTPISMSLTYQTSSVKTDAVNKLCAKFADRAALTNSQSQADAAQYYAMMKMNFAESGSQILQTAIKNMQNPMNIINAYPNLPKETGIFIGPFVLALLIMIISCPYMCCCCACPGCCPPSKCCKKVEGQPYTKCELVWPALVLLVALGFILAAGALGVSRAGNVANTVQTVGCSLAIVFDDILNGNVTSDGKYFIGLQPLASKLYDFSGQLTNINNSLDSVSSSVNTAGASYTTAINSIGIIPNGTAGQRADPINYQSPFDGSSALSNLPSNLPANLGSTAAGDSSTVLYITSSGITTIQNNIAQVSTNAQNVKSLLSGTFSSTLMTVQQTVLDIADKVKTVNTKFYQTYSTATPYMPTVTTAITGIYAGLIAVSAVAMLATLLMLICNLYKCRYLLYLTCFIMLIVGIISLLLVSIVSTIIPVLYFGCDATSFTLSSPTNFNAVFSPVLPASFAQYTSMATVCLKGGSGDLLQSTVLGNAAASITSLRDVMSSVGNFDAVAINAQVDLLWLSTYNLVNDYYSGKVIDFTSSADLAILNRLAVASNYGCTQLNTYGDSWVPYSGASPAISCSTTSANVPTSANCFTPAAAPNPFTTGASPCNGCIDTPTILKSMATNSININQRYTNANCATFIADMTSVYTNYYGVKESTYITKNIVSRTSTANTNVNNYKTAITNVGTSLDSVIATLTGAVSSIIDPTYGLVAGFNCALLGTDILMVNDVACLNGFTLLFFFRFAFGIAGIAILVALCCSTCTGVRHFKQSVAKAKAQLDRQKSKDNEKAQITMENILPTQAQQKNLMTRNYATKIQSNQNYYIDKPGFY